MDEFIYKSEIGTYDICSETFVSKVASGDDAFLNSLLSDEKIFIPKKWLRDNNEHIEYAGFDFVNYDSDKEVLTLHVYFRSLKMISKPDIIFADDPMGDNYKADKVFFDWAS